jgi:hypothetical protein
MSEPTQSEPRPPPADAYEINEVALTDIRVFKRLRPARARPCRSARGVHEGGRTTASY